MSHQHVQTAGEPRQCRPAPFTVALTVAVTCAFALAGCQAGPDRTESPGDSPPNPSDAQETRLADAARSANSPELVAAADLALPPVSQRDRLRPLTGDTLERARASLERILADTPRPDALEPRDADDAPAPDAEPPLDAQHAYAAGREAWHDGQSYTAIQHFERALRAAPDQPAILRMLATLYAETGNRVRAAMYLRQTLALEPADARSAFQLGRFALEQGREDDAIHLLHHALSVLDDAPRADSALRPLLHHHLAAALRRAGYARAAIEQHQLYREAMPERRTATGQAARDLALLEQQAVLSWLAVGDLHHQLGEPEDALAAYRHAEQGLEEQRAAGHDVPPSDEIVGRLIYTHLQLADADAARQLAIDHLHRTDATDGALAIVRYLTEHGAGGEPLADELRELYQREDRPASLALAIADLLPDDLALELLGEHAARDPGDVRILAAAVARLADPDDPAAIAEAIALTGDAIAHAPDAAPERAAVLFDALGGPTVLLGTFDDLPEDVRAAPAALTLRGLAFKAAGRMNEAAEPLEAALEADGELVAARLALARVALHHGEPTRAEALLAPLADRAEPAIVRLRVRALSGKGELDEALELLERHMDRDGRSVELILQKAQLQLRAGRANNAERTLLDALNAHPEDERIYAALLEMYDPPGEQASAVEDAHTQWGRLVRRLLSTMPDSRLGRLVRVDLMAAQSEYGDAVRLLQRMLEDDPLDMEVIEQLLRIHLQADRPDDAGALLEERIERHPHHHELLVLAVRFYRQTDDKPAARAVGDRLLALEPTDIGLVALLSELFLWADRPDKSVEAIEQALAADAVRRPAQLASLLARAQHRAGRGDAAAERLRELAERFPDHEADIFCELALLWDMMDEPDAAERALIKAHEKHPDNPRVNNALGYTWADRDKNLDEALEMIELAVDAEPDSAAYLDSLGWVYYKLGEFEQAADWLERSRDAGGGDHPVILDHLGDAYYRLDRPDDAARAWTRALARLRWIDSPEHQPELGGLEDRVRAKLRALERNESPPVATSPGADDRNDNAGAD